MQTEFKEVQNFRVWWHILLAGFPVIICSLLFALVYFNLIETKDGNKNTIAFIISLIATFIFFIWFITIKLETIINENGIFVNYIGMPFCKRSIKWEEIKEISIIKYSPLNDYGGWGVRYSSTGNGWCYNVSGDDGIKIIYTTEKPFLIGTQQKEEVEKIINYYFKK